MESESFASVKRTNMHYSQQGEGRSGLMVSRSCVNLSLLHTFRALVLNIRTHHFDLHKEIKVESDKKFGVHPLFLSGWRKQKMEIFAPVTLQVAGIV